MGGKLPLLRVKPVPASTALTVPLSFIGGSRNVTSICTPMNSVAMVAGRDSTAGDFFELRGLSDMGRRLSIVGKVMFRRDLIFNFLSAKRRTGLADMLKFKKCGAMF